MSATLSPSTRNITRVFRLATADERAAGLEWYATANDTAKEFSAAYGVSVEVAAGVLAATSPLNSWGANVKIARRMLKSGGTLDEGYLSVGLAKARRIMAGEDILSVLTSDKVRAFYLNIASRGMSSDITVDRHAFDIAVNVRHNDDTRPNIGKARYREVSAVYARAARILSREAGVELSAAQVQAITWVAWRNRYWAAGAFDPKN